MLLAVMVVQGMVGYTQYFTHLPTLLVGIHVLGASLVWATTLWFSCRLSLHAPETILGADDQAAPVEPAHSVGMDQVDRSGAPV
jgi:cytochrome c oxidase assembly protein subunit 15